MNWTKVENKTGPHYRLEIKVSGYKLNAYDLQDGSPIRWNVWSDDQENWIGWGEVATVGEAMTAAEECYQLETAVKDGNQ